jgi:hypothetical protein
MFHQTAAAKVAFQGLTKCKHNNIYFIPAEYSIAQFSRMHAQAIFIPVATSADFYSEGIQLDCRKRLKREQRLGAICWLHSCRRRAGITSGPLALDVSRFLRQLATSCSALSPVVEGQFVIGTKRRRWRLDVDWVLKVETIGNSDRVREIFGRVVQTTVPTIGANT